MLVRSLFVIIDLILQKKEGAALDIDAQINQMLENIDQETELEAELKQKAYDLATKIKNNPRQTTFIKGKQYTLSYKQSSKKGQIVMIDHTRLAIGGTHYKPAIFDLDYDERYSEFENLTKLILTIYYYKYNMIQAEDLEEEDDSVWQIQRS